MTAPNKLPVDNAARVAAATNLDTTFFVEAAAGTGKTTALVARILNIVTQHRARLHEIVAITFTEKAAGELKQRVREDLEKKLTGDDLRAALDDLERAHITTIHSFCASLLRERPVEAVVDPQFAVVDALQRELLFRDAWSQWLEAELAQNPPALRHTLMREVPLDQLADLAAMLVEHRDQLGPGCWPAAVPVSIPATLASLRALVPALESCLVHCVAKTENFFQRARTLLDALPQLEHAAPERAVAVLTKLELTAPRAKAEFESPEAFTEAKRLVKDAKAILEAFSVAADHNFLVELAAWLERFVAHWQQFKHTCAVLDFDDLLVKTRDLLRDKADVRRTLQARFRFLLVDEFQDTDPVQAEIVTLLGGDVPGKLFIVGDPKQSIYAFRRADIEMYAATQRALTQHGQQLVFRQNFRSQSTILDWVNEVFRQILVRSADGDYQPDYVELAACEKFKTNAPAVTLLRPPTWPAKQSIEEARRAEADAVARYLRGLVDAGACRWADVALLFRSFTAVEIFQESFAAHGVPCRVLGGRGYYQRQEIQTLISLLGCLDNPNDKLNLVAVLRSALFGWPDELVFLASEAGGLNYLRAVSDNEDDRVRETFALLAELHAERHRLPVAAFVERVFARTHFCQAFFALEPDSVANLLKALDLARQLEGADVTSLRGFVRQLRTTVVSGVDEEPAPAREETDNAVKLLTMHKSKGLQFPVVVLADLAGQSRDNGIRLVRQPGGRVCELRCAGARTRQFDAAAEEQDKRDTAEEIRLLYVAATRAERRLVIPWFKEKGGRLDLLAKGFMPVAGKLVEVPELIESPVGATHASPLRTDAPALIANRRAWQTEHAALLARAGKAVERVSPSKLAGEHEPYERNDRSSFMARDEAIELGIAVHAGLERMDATGLEGTARTLVERALKSELMARVSRADEVYRELPFATAEMEGKIDLLFREGARWTLVDYKTDARPEAEKYRAQMQAYVAALKQVAGVTVNDVLLFFVRTGEVKPITP